MNIRELLVILEDIFLKKNMKFFDRKLVTLFLAI